MVDEVIPSLSGWIPNPFAVNFQMNWESLDREGQLICLVGSLTRLQEIIVCAQSSARISDSLKDWDGLRKDCLAIEDSFGPDSRAEFLRSAAEFVLSARYGLLVSDYSPALGGALVCSKAEYLCQEGTEFDARSNNPEVPGLYSSFETKCAETAIWFAQSYVAKDRHQKVDDFSRDCICVHRPLAHRVMKVLAEANSDTQKTGARHGF